jgi:CRISPR-associated protein Cmr3
MIIRINPLDNFFFRDSKPFSAFENKWADGIFPPSPSVLYGALRAAYVSHKNINLDEIEEKTANFRITSIYYKLGGDSCIPVPLDLVEMKEKNNEQKNKETRNKTYSVLKLERKSIPNTLISNLAPNCKGLLSRDNDNLEVKTLDDGMIIETEFETYLEQGAHDGLMIKKLSDYLEEEPKIGIGMDATTYTTEESKLYRVNMKRAKKLFIFVSITGVDDFPEEGLIKLGGEGKVAHFQKNEPNFEINIQLSSNKFKLYLATPAIFKQGWCPDLSKKDIEATLITACIGKPLSIGGFDMLKKEPKPTYKAVPAGSVYYYETNEKPEDVLKKLQSTSISDIYPEQGFGIAYVGNI